MKINSSPRIAGVLLLHADPVTDDRGFFCRTFDADAAREVGILPESFLQDSISRSVRGAIRGFHIRTGLGESKLVRCSYGEIFDVVVDLRPNSLTYRNWESFTLRGDAPATLYIPAGCAHGFQALTEPADVTYRIDRVHDPSEEISIAYDDPELGIPWPLAVSAISRRDREAASLVDATHLWPEIEYPPGPAAG